MLVEILNPSAQIQPATTGFQPAGILAPRKNFSQHHSSFGDPVSRKTPKSSPFKELRSKHQTERECGSKSESQGAFAVVSGSR